MKKAAFIIVFAIVYRCAPVNYSGYVIAKEFEPKHMCCDTYQITNESSVIYVPIVHSTPPPHHHIIVAEKYTLFIANKYKGVIPYSVSKFTYEKFKCGQRIWIDKDGIIKNYLK